MKTQKIYWMPQPGPQTEAFTCPADETFAGGNRGGGKSDLILGREIDGAMLYGPHWNGIVFRRKYKDFKELRRRIDEIIRTTGLPATRVGGENQMNYIKYNNGAMTTFAAAGSLESLDDWWSHQFTHVSIEEAQSFPFLAQMMDKLKGSMRSPHGVPCRMLLTGNPGGPGASQIKAMFIPISYGGDLEDAEEGKVHWIEIHNEEDGTVAKISRVFIEMPLEANRILVESDPKYVNMLRTISDPVLRAAWIAGRWDVHIGQAFDFGRKNILERPIWPIPEYAPIFMTFDYGFGAPFSVGWWWVDGDGRIYRFAEWYGWQGAGWPNIGLRYTDQRIADGILEREKKLEISNRTIIRLAGPDNFRRKANYMGGGQGPATSDSFVEYANQAEVKEKYGEISLKLIPGDADRKTKIRQFRNRLDTPPGELPMLMVYPNCKAFIRTIPALVNDETNPEDIDQHGQEDHCYDEACHICQYMPMGTPDEKILSVQREKAREEAKKKLDTASLAALKEWEMTVEQILEEEERFNDLL